MNENFKQEIKDRFLGFDETANAKIFNIFANDIDNLEQTLRKEDAYVFNLLDNKQAAMAVRKFGFEPVAKVANEDWIIYAECDAEGKWRFSSKAPSIAVSEYLEPIIYDIIYRPKEYPSFVWEAISQPLMNLIAF